MKIEKNGYFVESQAGGEPYEIFMGDLWSCPSCEISIVSGFGSGPVAMRHDDDFEERRKALKPLRLRG